MSHFRIPFSRVVAGQRQLFRGPERHAAPGDTQSRVSGPACKRAFFIWGFYTASEGLKTSGTGPHDYFPQVGVTHLPSLIQHLAPEAEQTGVLSFFFRRRYCELGFSQ
jgi:hypothetical protein